MTGRALATTSGTSFHFFFCEIGESEKEFVLEKIRENGENQKKRERKN
jgi:hypothetical protein